MKGCILFAFFLLASIEWNGIKTVHTEEEWLELLGTERYQIMRQKGTQRAYTGNYLNDEGPATYSCAACHLPLFDGKDQYQAGNGYLSFKKAIATKNIYFAEDWTFSFKRYEILCRGCDSHLGHIFNDGPPPKHLRFCINPITLDRKD